ncbi:MAG: hypothetical protein HY721_01610, partial [Planctomycetes bacterium]|nr:hypothetical protein [Planctomycetota bacterium]
METMHRSLSIRLLGFLPALLLAAPRLPAGVAVACDPAVFGDPAADPLTIDGAWDL